MSEKRRPLLTHYAINAENLTWLRNNLAQLRRSIDLVFLDPPRMDGSKARKGLPKRESDKWVKMVKSRVELSRQTLHSTGILAALTHERELPYLRLLLDEVFGESNLIGTVVIDTGKVQNSARFLSVTHEYLLVYAKNLQALTSSNIKWRIQREGLEQLRTKERQLRSRLGDNYEAITAELKEWLHSRSFPARLKQFYRADDKGLYAPGDLSAPKNGLQYTVINPNTGVKVATPKRGWALKQESLQRLQDNNMIIWPNDDTHQPLKKIYLSDRPDQVVQSVMNLPSRNAGAIIPQVLGTGVTFSETLPLSYMETIIDTFTEPDAIILDPFAGSGTTGHAVLNLNYAHPQNSARRFIAVAFDEDRSYSDMLYPRLQAVITGKWADRTHRPRKAVLATQLPERGIE